LRIFRLQPSLQVAAVVFLRKILILE